MSFSYNNPLIIGDINAKIKAEIGNLDDLETTDKSSLVNALNEAIDSTLNGASRDLDNLSDEGNDKLRSLNAYANQGELLTDSECLAFVKNYSHSTFDRSKFTVVGSPNITDDGIASGFSTSNYLSFDINIPVGSKIKICGRFTTPSTLTGNIGCIFSIAPEENNRFWLQQLATGEIQLGAMDGTSRCTSVSSLELGTTYDFEGSYINGSLNLRYKKITDISFTVLPTASQTGNFGSGSPATLVCGGYYVNNTNLTPYSGSIDLKQFSTTVDGVEVFSGNKTGIDTIKADNYTASNSANIMADGVFDQSLGYGYITVNDIGIDVNRPFKIEIPFTKIASTSSGSYPVGYYENSFANVYMNDSGFVPKLVFDDNGTATILTTSPMYLAVPNIGETVNFVIEYDGNQTYTISLIKQNGTVSSGTITTSLKLNSTMLFVGRATYGETTQYMKADLNKLKAWSAGDLVYQGCLKIPYTESKTGSKIVDSIYRDRVNDMAEQFGYANYYTLSDTDFTLPQVELYGLIGQRTLRDSYRNGATYWELWSDRTLEIGGTCTSGVEYNLPKNFTSATDYILSVPYSAKTASSFTPTVSGDFIAKGLGVL